MSKTLITVDNLQDFVSGGRLQMDGSKILTAGARDELTRRGIEVAWSDAPAACCGNPEKWYMTFCKYARLQFFQCL